MGKYTPPEAGKGQEMDFPGIDDGPHIFEIGDVKWAEKEGDKAETTLYFPARVVVGDPNEGGFASLFCDVTKKFGVQRLYGIFYCTGYHKVMEEKYKLPSLLNGDWDDKWLLDTGYAKQKEIIINEVLGGGLKDYRFKGDVKNEVQRAGKNEGKTMPAIKKIFPADDTPSPAGAPGPGPATGAPQNEEIQW
jgi:hypothetical protein